MPVGPLLKDWRRRRGLSQLDFALLAQVSTRHLSYVETGRSVPSRELVLHLAELLEVPLRERNALLLAAGYAPVFSARTLEDDSSGMPFVRGAVARLLASHEPYPALVIDRYWNVVDRNRSTEILVQGVAGRIEHPGEIMRIGRLITAVVGGAAAGRPAAGNTEGAERDVMTDYVEHAARKRWAYRVQPEQIISWDHSKLAGG